MSDDTATNEEEVCRGSDELVEEERNAEERRDGEDGGDLERRSLLERRSAESDDEVIEFAEVMEENGVVVVFDNDVIPSEFEMPLLRRGCLDLSG